MLTMTKKKEKKYSYMLTFPSKNWIDFFQLVEHTFLFGHFYSVRAEAAVFMYIVNGTTCNLMQTSL